MSETQTAVITTAATMQDITITDPVASARAAGLRYITDARPGIRRRRVGRHFSYVGLDGQPIHDPKELQRIKSLAIPPAWTDVWISPSPRGHIQATGRDAKGRKQYRYHPRWREVRDETKYGRMILFGETLPLIRKRVDDDLALQGLPREKVLATVVELLDMTHIRIGNEEYAQSNESYGLTTLRPEHVDVAGATVTFAFRGKSGKEHVVDVRDRRLARIVKRCQDLSGYELFQFIDGDGERRTIESDDVNAYLREISGQDFTAKDFRTWAGTVIAARTLRQIGPFSSQTEAKKNIVDAIKITAQELGNTPAICRKSYVHPAVIDAYMDGSLLRISVPPDAVLEGLRREEAEVLEMLRRAEDAAA